MRLDHLLSKEKIIVSLFCRLVGCWLVPRGGKFFAIARGFRVWWQVFSGGKRLVCAHVLCARVGLWELMKQRLLRSFGLVGWRV